MKLARYHEENLGHFGLATEMYAHFTSPIRRYPDLVVHRALRALREGQDGEREAWLEGLPEMGLHLSERERRASDAERELVEWKKVRFMAGKLGETLLRLRDRRAGLRPVRRARGDLRPGPRARLVDDRRLLPLRREGPPPRGREHAARSTASATASRCRSHGWTSSGGRSTSPSWTCSSAPGREAAKKPRRWRRAAPRAGQGGAAAARGSRTAAGPGAARRGSPQRGPGPGGDAGSTDSCGDGRRPD